MPTAFYKVICICLKWTTRKYVCEQCKKRCQIHINIKNIAKMNIMNIEDEGRQEDLHSRWTTPCRRHLNSTPAEVTKDWCHLFLVKYCKYFPINFKIHGTLPPFRKNGDLSKILIVCFSIVVAQQMFFSVLIFLCVFIYDVLFVNVRVLTIWQTIRASVMSFITGAPVVKIIKLYHHFFPLKS